MQSECSNAFASASALEQTKHREMHLQRKTASYTLIHIKYLKDTIVFNSDIYILIVTILRRINFYVKSTNDKVLSLNVKMSCVTTDHSKTKTEVCEYGEMKG